MENIGAVKELCKVTDNLENRIDELERMNSKLAKLKRIDSLKSTSSGSTVTSLPTSSAAKKPLRHKPRRLDNQGLCSNKFVQGTIIVLILVMAMCLIAMATLYILEWQKRQYYDMPTPTTTTDSSSYPYNSTSSSSFGNFTSTPNSSSIADRSRNSTQRGITTASPNTFARNSTIIHATSSSFTVRVLGKKEPIGIPSQCVGSKAQTNNCRSFCCGDSMTLVGSRTDSSRPKSSTRSTTPRPTTTTTRIPTTTATRLSSVVVTPSSFRSTNNHVNIHSYEVEHSTQDNRVLQVDNESIRHNQYPMVSRTNKLPFMKSKTGNMEKPMRKRRNANTVEQGPLAEIPKTIRSVPNKSDFATLVRSVKLVELNQSISPEYCSNCRDGNYTHHIPVSRYMTHQNLTLQFRLWSVPSSTYIDYCRTDNKVTSGCSTSHTHGVSGPVVHNQTTNARKTKEQNPSWVLPIGKFDESSYKFRVTNIPDHLVACTAEVQFANVTFVEYNFVFYRSCND